MDAILCFYAKLFVGDGVCVRARMRADDLALVTRTNIHKHAAKRMNRR